MNSIWLNHPRYPNYLFSLEGRCLNIDTGKILKRRFKKTGYEDICLYIHGKPKHIRIHRVLAEIFLKNKSNKPNVNHINGIKSDNRISNLEWCIKSENQRHSIDVLGKTFKHKEGENNNFSKLNEKQVLEIRKRLETYKLGDTIRLAKEFNVTHGTISMIKSRKIWAHLA